VPSEPDSERIEYLEWLAAVEKAGVTPPLAEYLRWTAYDGNLPWRLGPGHLLNLLDQAVDVIEAAYGNTAALRGVLEAVIPPEDRS